MTSLMGPLIIRMEIEKNIPDPYIVIGGENIQLQIKTTPKLYVNAAVFTNLLWLVNTNYSAMKVKNTLGMRARESSTHRKTQ